jgi:hypothetical protein
MRSRIIRARVLLFSCAATDQDDRPLIVILRPTGATVNPGAALPDGSPARQESWEAIEVRRPAREGNIGNGNEPEEQAGVP